ncbi:pollen allergen Phl p 1 [Brachypodium distachyon]|uniref:Expansin-like EG45 domain-containing protein n=1 Tax=Brachypodium distachyon TaxID=15368 RepID=I1IG03_BRADI|nr:pollen allergen Phl p 1 [Brachypodium distachyon]KQJ85579.1 hypothetical protein BRADI_4g00360v3 [Brachypodium distachyon]|eukprot:XP_003577577.1 pollen allergen Phl p 1 [Brachypodium distachyon]
MAASSSQVMLAMALLAALLSLAHGIPKVPPGPNITATYNGKWLDAKSTWYGRPEGAGPKDNGGACGYKDVDKPPFNGMTSCGNTPIFRDGRGCGSCFEIKCDKPAEFCSGQPVLVHITDDNEEPIAAYHFDLSGKAFGSMAKKGQEQKLRGCGEVEIQFRRVKCYYPLGTKVTYHVEKGSNPNYLALLVKFVGGDGDVVAVEVQEKGKYNWIPLKESWGAVWRIDTAKPLKGPLSVRYTTDGGTKAVSPDVIPEKWKPDTMYVAKY